MEGSGPSRILSLWTLALGCLDIAVLRTGALGVTAESLDMVKVPAVAGSDVTLPCDTSSAQPSDVLLLVVWYKNDIPLYSYDARIKGPSAHWADDVLGGRARWHPNEPSVLRIRDLVPNDRALYRCRVDFKVSPTRNHKIMLDVIELPEKPKIFDEFDKELVGVAGPYVEDSSLKLTCVVSGGRPMPRVRWWRDDKVIATLPPLEDGSRLSMLELRIPKLTRSYFEAVYTCTADNTVLAPPSRVNIQIQIYLRPLRVEILTREQPLAVGQRAELACRAVGARPAAVITWWLDNQQMTSTAAQENSDDRNETVSRLRWTPRMDQDGRALTCRASHPHLEHSTIETSITLNLHYVPIVTLQLGSKLNPDDIEEGDDVYFECIVKSNPPAYKVVWEHNDQLMTHNQRAGVIAGSAHLALQGVSRSQAGKYACTASNVEGDGKSLPVDLHIIYKPVCVATTTLIIGAAINEPTNVTCEVDGFPPPTNFQWTLNNSMGTHEIEADKVTVDAKGRSVLSYTATTEKDYGSLACRATNLAGQQMEPCRYSLLPAVRPEPLSNCSTVNLTEDSAEIRCTAGYDGGLVTTYFVEVWDGQMLAANVSTSQPAWVLRGLGSGKSLTLVIYAGNARGRSEVAEFNISTLSRLALHEDVLSSKNEADFTWALGALAGVAGTLAGIVFVTLLAKRRHRAPARYQVPLQTTKSYKDPSLHTHSANQSPAGPDDKNPDVVPLGKDYNSARDVQRPPEPPPYGALTSPPVGVSRSDHSIHRHEVRPATPHTPVTPASDVHSIGTLTDDRRSITSGTFTRRREVVTTRTPLLANARESCV